MLIFEHGALYNIEGELADRRRRRSTSTTRRSAAPGSDVTLITYGGTLPQVRSTRPSELAGEGIDAEVIDLRTLRPLDDADDPRLGARARTAR